MFRNTCMNYTEAFKLLEIDYDKASPYVFENIDEDFLKKRYHKLALKYHPDKNNNTPESNEYFQKIKDAYIFLDGEIKHHKKRDRNNDSPKNNTNNNKRTPSDIYTDILQGFVQNIFSGSYDEMILNIVKEIVTGCQKVSSKLFDNISKDATIHIYDFLSANRNILHISVELLNDIRNIVVKKYDEVSVYKLNPSLEDMIEHNLYKLYVDDKLFLVPLWHNELYFDNSGCDIIVICEPELPKHIWFDDDNNIYYELSINSNEIANMILKNECVEIKLSKRSIQIPVSELYMKPEQYYRVKNKGLTKIKDDIYDVTEMADLIVKINLV